LIARHLITTADERAWKTDRPVVFLGEWCRRFDRQSAWAPLDGVVARPVRFDGDARWRMLEGIASLSREMVRETGEALNAFHGTRNAPRFWRILMSHWMHRYVGSLHHRWHALRQALEDYEISGTTVLDSPGFNLAVPDTDSYTWACGDGLWNNVLIARIWEHMGNAPPERQPVLASAAGDASTPAAGASSALSPGQLLGRFAAFLQKDTDALIVNSYLPRWTSVALNLRLLQVPRRRISPRVQPVPVDPSARARFALDSQGHDAFGRLLRKTLPELLPTCFLEGFGSLERQAREIDWPRRPRFIYTCNSFDSDEVFKLWTAQRVAAGRPYITGQHGNNYGSARYCPSESEAECVATSDAFVTWGWREEDPRYRPAFIFKTGSRRAMPWRRDGGLLLIEVCFPHLLQAWDPYPDYTEYQEEQFRFVQALPDAIRGTTTVRLHAEFRRQSWREEMRWQQRAPNIRLDDGTAPVIRQIAQSRLVVHSYDSTGILETLALNVPTLAFWRNGLQHVRDSAAPYYQPLLDAGIVFESAADAATKVTEVWSNVGAWWASAEVQRARQIFCDRFARHSAAPSRELARILTGVRAAT
jgi:putative transferase (TIGR04331 family)